MNSRINRQRKNTLLLIGFSLITAFLFVLFFSKSTSFLYNQPDLHDSGTFLTIGKYWAHGHLPYRDLFDHKGPLLFFINALGYILTGNRFGVMTLQILFFTCFTFITYKCYRTHFTRNWAIVLIIITLCAIPISYEVGNTVEEYSLPLFMLSFFFIHKWVSNLYSNEFKHNAIYSFIYGLLFAFCFLTRLSNAIALCCSLFIIVVTLVVKKEWSNLLKNALSFLLGFTIVTLPFVIYFWSNDAIEDFWYGTIAYNIEYSRNISGIVIEKMSLTSFISILSVLNCIILILIGIHEILFYSGRKLAGLMWLFIGGITLIWLVLTLRNFVYVTCFIPFWMIVFFELKVIMDDSKSQNKRKFVSYLNMTICSVLLFEGAWKFCRRVQDVYRNEQHLELKEMNVLIDEIPVQERDSFIAYNCYSDIYLYNSIQPCYPFFIIQDWQGNLGESLNYKIHKTFDEGCAKWILYQHSEHPAIIQDVLDNRYEIVNSSEDGNYILYRLKDSE